MDSLNGTEIEKLDEEWIDLLRNARDIGLTLTQVSTFLQQQKESSNTNDNC